VSFGNQNFIYIRYENAAFLRRSKQKNVLSCFRLFDWNFKESKMRLLKQKTNEHPTKMRATWVLGNDPEMIPPLMEHLKKATEILQVCNDNVWQQVALAVHEALQNAIMHGNLEISSAQRTSDSEAYRRLITERRQTLPYSNRCVYLNARVSQRAIIFIVRDEGPGFDVSQLPDPTSPGNLDKPNGRGVFLIRALMDKVNFNRVGNQITMVKKWELAGEEAA
jgi:anti-sigma regulatory factor (Ser/Thr protein kinase)